MQKPNVFSFTAANDLGPQFTVIEGREPSFGEESGEGLSILYNASEVDEFVGEEPDEKYLLVDTTTVQKAFMFKCEGYRGYVCYNAYIKVNDIWYDCDLVSEGMAYPTTLDDEAIQKIVDDVLAEDNEDEEEEEDED